MADAPGTYTVQPGDTLSRIAAKVGVDWHDLAAWNGIAAPYTIHPGDVLRTVPPTPAPDPLASIREAVAAISAEQVKLAARVKVLEDAQQPTPPTPPAPPAKPTTDFGVDVSSAGGDDAWVKEATAQRKLFGGLLPRVRVFTTGKPLPWSHPKMRALTAADRPVPSFKAWDLPALNTFMDGIPPELDEVDVAYHHEMEDDAKKSGNIAKWIDGYLATYAAMDAARKAHPNGHKVKLVKIAMRYQEVDAHQAGVTYREFHGGQDFVDAFGWDCYWPSYKKPTTAEEFLGPVVQCSVDTGLPWCVPELGVQDPALRVPLLTDCIAFAREHGALWVSYWNEAQWKLDGAALALWQQAVKGGS